MPRTLLLPMLLAVGCAPLGDFEDDPVVGAHLRNLDTNTAMVVGGGVWGDAVLVYETPSGEFKSLPVTLNGGTVGVALAITTDLNPGSDVALDLSDADPGLTARDLLGTYSGTGWNLTVGLGGSGHQLRNPAGVRLSDEHFTAGLGMEAGLEWLRVREGGRDGWDVDDTGFLVVDTDPLDTDDTDDTDAGDTDGADTDVAPIDTGTPPRTGGCGSRRDTAADTDPTPNDSDAEPDPEPEPEPDPDPGPSDPGDGSGCDGSGCDADSGCACSTGGLIPAPMLALFIALSRRQRRRP